jgi:hypothetical protein
MIRAAFLLVFSAGCVAKLPLDRSTANGTIASGVELEEVPTRGFQVEVHEATYTWRGELIAVEPGAVWIAFAGELRDIVRNDIEFVQVRHGPRVSGTDIDRLYQFARFPQGLFRARPAPPAVAPVPDQLAPPEGEPFNPYQTSP